VTRVGPISSVGSRLRPALAAMLTVAMLVAGCSESHDPTPTATVSHTPTATATGRPVDILPSLTPTASATAPPTPTPLPAAAPSGLWVFDLARKRLVTLYEGEALVRAEPGATGSAVSATMVDEEGVHAVRYSPDGEPIETYDDRSSIVVSANGESRFYLDMSDPESPGIVVEHDGEEVPLEGTRPRVGISFSPSGDRLLTVSERPGATADEVVQTFSVHNTTDGRLRMQFEHRALAGSAPVANWSPSGRYVADEGLEGLFVRDTQTGNAWWLGPRGSPRWSRGAEQLLVVSQVGRIALVNVPELDGIDLGEATGGEALQFDRSGALALVTSYADPEARSGPTTRAYDVSSGSEMAAWPGMALDAPSIGGRAAAIGMASGVAAVFESPTCPSGFVVYHPALGADGRCVEGAQPRWSRNGQLLVYARGREVVLLSVATDEEQVLTRGTPVAGEPGGPELSWSADESWILIQWSRPSVDLASR
jgi:WD40 repeat protein